MIIEIEESGVTIETYGGMGSVPRVGDVFEFDAIADGKYVPRRVLVKRVTWSFRDGLTVVLLVKSLDEAVARNSLVDSLEGVAKLSSPIRQLAILSWLRNSAEAMSVELAKGFILQGLELFKDRPNTTEVQGEIAEAMAAMLDQLSEAGQGALVATPGFVADILAGSGLDGPRADRCLACQGSGSDECNCDCYECTSDGEGCCGENGEICSKCNGSGTIHGS